jgi:uncharacterized SAM-binding protein YcdF (DUF218 family)
MPPRPPASGGSLRRIILSVCVLIVVLGAYGFVELGAFLAREDALQKADAIVVLAGSIMERPMEAADLYHDGYSRTIVLTRQQRDGGELALVGRGVAFLEDVERVQQALLELGIPREVIVIPPRIHNSTAAEAITIRELSASHDWRRVIVVSSKYHLRRARFAFRRELAGAGVEVSMRGTRYDPSDPERWWRHRADIRDVGPEALKLVAYALGLGA